MASDAIEGRRIVVVGTSAAGKTTLARGIAERLRVPHVELDALFWGPDWTRRDDFEESVRHAVAADAWVVDGNYSRVRDLVWGRATSVVWLDYRFLTVFGRALRRTIRRAVTGEALWAGNRESLAKAFFSRDSILWWVITTHRRRKREYGALAQEGAYPGLEIVRLRSPREADDLLRRIGR